MPVRTLLADSSAISLIGLRSIFSEVARVEIIGEAHDPIELQAMLVREKPDVVLIDHTAKGFTPDVIRECRQRHKRARFVAITPDPSRMALVSALRGGVTSYIKKDCDVQEIIDAVLETAEGRKFFCGQVLEAIQRMGVNVRRITEEPLSCEPVVLTDRESEILALIAQGCSYTTIAGQLGLSAHTVTSHRKKIMQKIGANSTAGLVLYAVKSGMVSPNRYLFNA